MNYETACTKHNSAVKYGLLSLLAFAGAITSIVLICRQATKTWYLDDYQWTIQEDLYACAFFILTLTILLSVYLFFYGYKLRSYSSSKFNLYRSYAMMSSILVLPNLFSFIMQIMLIKEIKKAYNISFLTWLKLQKIPVSETKFSKNVYLLGIFGFLVQLIYVALTGVHSDFNGKFYYSPSDWYRGWFAGLSIIGNFLVFIYLFMFVFFNKYKIMQNNTFLIAVTTYMIIVGIVFHAVISPYALKYKNPDFWYFKDYFLEHIFSVLFVTFFGILLIMSGRYSHSIQTYWITMGKVAGFGIAYIVYIYLLPFTCGGCIFSFANINTEIGGEMINILWPFLVVIVAIGVASGYYLLHKKVTIGSAFIWFKLPKEMKKQHLNREFVKNYLQSKLKNENKYVDVN